MKYLKTYEDHYNYPLTDGTKIISDEELYELIKTNCKDFCFDDPTIFRDVYLYFHKYLINTDKSFKYSYKEGSKKFRKSAYTTNHYTLLLNHLQSWSKYPKRNVICSTLGSVGMAINTFRVIPFDGVKIGVTHSQDIQNSTHNSELYKEFEIEGLFELGDIFNNNRISDLNWTTFQKSMEEHYENTKNELFNIETLNKVITPEKMNFRLLDYKEFVDDDILEHECREIWIDKNHLLIPLNEVYNFRKNFNI